MAGCNDSRISLRRARADPADHARRAAVDRSLRRDQLWTHVAGAADRLRRFQIDGAFWRASPVAIRETHEAYLDCRAIAADRSRRAVPRPEHVPGSGADRLFRPVLAHSADPLGSAAPG